jgi:putative hydrolase of the HAD superfamily
MRKPDPEIFQLSADKLGVPADECLFVDDVAKYLEVARALGMRTLHATSPEATINGLRHVFAE